MSGTFVTAVLRKARAGAVVLAKLALTGMAWLPVLLRISASGEAVTNAEIDIAT